MERTVCMQVPISLIQRVIDLLDEYEYQAAGRPDAAGAEGTERVFVPQQGPWSSTEVEALATRAVDRKYHLVVALLDYAADSPGEWVTPGTLGADSPYHLRNQLSALTRLVKKDFDGRRYWPMEWKRGDDGSYVYRLLPEVAAWWNTARAAQQTDTPVGDPA